MSFPTLLGTATGQEAANTATHTINLPDGSNVVGRKVVVCFVTDANPTVTWPSGWASFVAVVGVTSQLRMEIRTRTIDGTEGFTGTGDTISITTGTIQGSAHISRLHGNVSGGGAPEGASVAPSGTGTDLDPPNLAPGGGAADITWHAFGGIDGNVSVTGFPADYTDTAAATSGFTGGVAVGGAVRNLNAASENPGALTASGAQERVAATVAVYPNPGGGGGGFAVKAIINEGY